MLFARRLKRDGSSLSSKSTNQPNESLLQLFPVAVISGADPCWIRHLSRVRPVAVTLLLSQEESLTVDGRLGKAKAATFFVHFLALFEGETDAMAAVALRSCLFCSRQPSWYARES